MYSRCMKRINITLPDELSEQIESLAERKEMSVAEIARRGIELYLQRFPERTAGNRKLPVFDLGEPKQADFKEAVYRKRVKDIAD